MRRGHVHLCHTSPVFILLRPTSHMEFIYELLHFLKVRKKFWLLPIILVMLVFGGLIVLAQGSAVAPFIYTLF